MTEARAWLGTDGWEYEIWDSWWTEGDYLDVPLTADIKTVQEAVSYVAYSWHGKKIEPEEVDISNAPVDS